MLVHDYIIIRFFLYLMMLSQSFFARLSPQKKFTGEEQGILLEG